MKTTSLLMNSEMSRLTSEFLTTLSRRLSSRVELKGTEYKIEIGPDYVHMNPVVYIFPDRFHRKDSDKKCILDYLVNYIFQDISTNTEIVNDTVKVKSDSLVPGTYIYKLYQPARRRKWVRTA